MGQAPILQSTNPGQGSQDIQVGVCVEKFPNVSEVADQTLAMLNQWLGTAGEKQGLSSNTAADPKGAAT